MTSVGDFPAISKALDVIKITRKRGHAPVETSNGDADLLQQGTVSNCSGGPINNHQKIAHVLVSSDGMFGGLAARAHQIALNEFEQINRCSDR